VIESRCGARLALKSISCSLGRKRSRQNFDGYLTMQPRIPRPIHLAHAAFADGLFDLVRSEAGSGVKNSRR
jgi:hypothetical protein